MIDFDCLSEWMNKPNNIASIYFQKALGNLIGQGKKKALLHSAPK